MRSISDKEQLSLKAATRRAIKMAGGQDEFEQMTRVRQAALSKYGSTAEDCADKFIPVDVAVEADIEAGSPIITAKMAELLGYTLTPVRAVSPVAPLTMRDALRVANEAADVVKAITSALEDDGKIDSAESIAISREIEEAISVLRDALARVSVRT